MFRRLLENWEALYLIKEPSTHLTSRERELLKKFVDWLYAEVNPATLNKKLNEFERGYFVCPDCGYKVSPEEFLTGGKQYDEELEQR